MNLKVMFVIFSILIVLVGCNESALEKQDKVEIKSTEVNNVVEEETPEESKLSYAEKHPELEQEIIDMFALDKEYSGNITDFFGLGDNSNEFGYFPNIYASEPSSNYIDYYTALDAGEDGLLEKTVLRVGTKEFSGYMTNDDIRFGGAIMGFNVFRNKSHELKNINEDKQKWQATDYEVPNDAGWFTEFATEFDVILQYTEGLVGSEEYVLYKFIPLNDDYKLAIRLKGARYDIKENLDKIKYSMENIIYNPVINDSVDSGDENNRNEDNEEIGLTREEMLEIGKNILTEFATINAKGTIEQINEFTNRIFVTPEDYLMEDVTLEDRSGYEIDITINNEKIINSNENGFVFESEVITSHTHPFDSSEKAYLKVDFVYNANNNTFLINNIESTIDTGN